MKNVRYATVKGNLDTIRNYLPSNYSAAQRHDGSVLIFGVDSAGWTLDGYVIPRLASGMYYAKELEIA